MVNTTGLKVAGTVSLTAIVSSCTSVDDKKVEKQSDALPKGVVELSEPERSPRSAHTIFGHDREAWAGNTET